jgi:hypothetical protein
MSKHEIIPIKTKAILDEVVGYEDGNFHLCTSDDMHPWECNHDKTCIHCAKRKTKDHDPKKCALCLDE